MPELPFGENLIKSGLGETEEQQEKLLQLENNPEKIIRSISFADLEKRHFNRLNAEEIATISKRLYKELGEQYNIPVPVEFFIGKDNNDHNAIYSVTDRVHGNNLFHQDFTSPENIELIEKLDDLFVSLISYLRSKLNTNDYYLTDIYKDSQYVYGTTSKDSDPRIYLVDAEPLFYKGRGEIYRHLFNLSNTITIYEETQNTKFGKAREAISAFVNEESIAGFESPQAEARARDYIQKIKDRFNLT
jgi:hypothetical protein